MQKTKQLSICAKYSVFAMTHDYNFYSECEILASMCKVSMQAKKCENKKSMH